MASPYDVMLFQCEGAFAIYIGRRVDLYRRLLHIVLPSIESAKASHAQLPDMPLRSDTLFPSPYREYSSYSVEGKVPFS